MACNETNKKKQLPKNNTYESHEVSDTLMEFTGRVTGIKDGDTFEILREGKPEKVRLSDIDSPENTQPFGKMAKNYASNLCFGKEVRVLPKSKRDRYGRIVGTIYINDTTDVNARLLKAGYAWRYRYSRNKGYALLRKIARKNKVGLWSDANAIDPWQWRKNRITRRR